MAAPLRLQVSYPNRRTLLSSARPEGSALSLFVPVVQQAPVGSEVLLDISVEGTALRFQLEGRVRVLFTGQVARQGPGLGIALVAEQKRAAAQMLAILAGRSLDDGTALDSRHEVDVRCLVKLRGQKLEGKLCDVSNTGAFIGAPPVPALTDDVKLTIQLEPLFGRWGGRLLNAKVIWVGEKKGVPGFGVRFLDGTAHVRESLKKHFPAPVRASPPR